MASCESINPSLLTAILRAFVGLLFHTSTLFSSNRIDLHDLMGLKTRMSRGKVEQRMREEREKEEDTFDAQTLDRMNYI